MTPRERVLGCLEFTETDRAPRDLWALPWVDMFAAEEKSALLAECPGDFTGPGKVLGGSDRARGTPARKGTYVDEWGVEWECGEDGVIGEVKSPPLADFSALDSFAPPWEFVEKADWTAAGRAQERNTAGEARFMLAGSGVRPFERMQFLRGTENLLIDMAYGTAEFRRLLEMVHEFELKLMEGWASTAVDGVSFMDDWGSQTALLISPPMWREIFKPVYARYCEIVHASGKKVFFHSDGHIEAIYPDLIEIGVDAVNSQLFCMDIEDLGRLHRGRITFWGEIDRQRVLPFGTVDDVRAAVGRVRRALGDGTSGGVIAQCEWGPSNPAGNIRAVYEAWDAPLEELP